jgi:hypothetical protein
MSQNHRSVCLYFWTGKGPYEAPKRGVRMTAATAGSDGAG